MIMQKTDRNCSETFKWRKKLIEISKKVVMWKLKDLVMLSWCTIFNNSASGNSEVSKGVDVLGCSSGYMGGRTVPPCNTVSYEFLILILKSTRKPFESGYAICFVMLHHSSSQAHFLFCFYSRRLPIKTQYFCEEALDRKKKKENGWKNENFFCW